MYRSMDIMGVMAAAAGEQDDPLVPPLVEIELTEGPAGVHLEPYGRVVVEECRDIAVRHPLGRDLDIGALGRGGRDRVGTRDHLPVNLPLEREELSGSRREPVRCGNKEAETLGIMSLHVDPSELQPER